MNHIIKLSDETIVTMSKVVTRRAMRLHTAKVNSGVTFKMVAGSKVEASEINPTVIDEANQVLVLNLIDSISRGNEIISPSDEWLDSLPQIDYDKLLTYALDMKEGLQDAVEEGKKNSAKSTD